MLWRTRAGTSPRITTSDTASRPPGLAPGTLGEDLALVDRQVDDAVRDDHIHRVPGSGISSMVPLRNSTLVAPPSPCSTRPGQHLISHVEAIGAAGGPDTLADSSTSIRPAAEVEHRLARVQLGQGRVAAAKRCQDCGLGERRRLFAAVQVAGDRSSAGPQEPPQQLFACPRPPAERRPHTPGAPFLVSLPLMNRSIKNG
jgi:hypothetical protein